LGAQHSWLNQAIMQRAVLVTGLQQLWQEAPSVNGVLPGTTAMQHSSALVVEVVVNFVQLLVLQGCLQPTWLIDIMTWAADVPDVQTETTLGQHHIYVSY
jgi:hypothetical protein